MNNYEVTFLPFKDWRYQEQKTKVKAKTEEGAIDFLSLEYKDLFLKSITLIDEDIPFYLPNYNEIQSRLSFLEHCQKIRVTVLIDEDSGMYGGRRIFFLFNELFYKCSGYQSNSCLGSRSNFTVNFNNFKLCNEHEEKRILKVLELRTKKLEELK